MMFLLSLDVAANVPDVGFADGKRTITGLPGESGIGCVLRLDPFRRGFLDVFGRFTQREFSRKLEEDVNVIGYGINQDAGRLEVIQHRGHVGMEVLPNVVGQIGSRFFVLKMRWMFIRESDWATGEVGRPFRAQRLFFDLTQGVALGCG